MKRTFRLGRYGLSIFREERRIPLSNLDFSTRTYNALYRHRITTLEELLRQSDDELLRFRNLGVKALNEIHQVLEAYR